MEVLIIITLVIAVLIILLFKQAGKTYNIPMRTNRELLLSVSERYEGLDASPNDLVDDSLGCAESISNIIDAVVPFPVVTGTWTLMDTLKKDSRFKGTLDLLPGNILLFPTGTGKARLRGHVFIIGENGTTWSNNSFNGKWGNWYTVEEAVHRYVTLGGLDKYVFELTGEVVDKKIV